MKDLGHECVMASEIQQDLKELYIKNHNANLFLKLIGDIHKEIEVKNIPPFEVLCAGFPCQPFSQAGHRRGLKDPLNGNHFLKIVEIISYHKPEYIFLENVPTLKSHDNGNTWGVIKTSLENENYSVKERILSPDEFGVPQQRKRIYITAIRKDCLKGEIVYPTTTKDKKININKFLEKGPVEDIPIRSETLKQIKHWEKFLKKLNKQPHKEITGFPIWAVEFGATYPYKETPTKNIALSILNKHKGTLGKEISTQDKNDLLNFLPRYALTSNKRFPPWKIKYIKKNREFYTANKKWIDEWKKEILGWNLSYQKLEWNCGRDAKYTLKDKIIQFRPSGIRVKNKDRFPALVLSITQTPIIYDKHKVGGEGFRHITNREAANLQSFPRKKFSILKNKNAAIKAFGNAVNVKVVKEIMGSVIFNNEKDTNKKLNNEQQ